MAQQNLQEIRKSLMEQLQSKHADVAHQVDLIDTYIDYCKLERKAKANIRRRGTTYEATSSTGKQYEKDNPDVKALPQYTRMKLQILKDMGLTAEKTTAEEDEEL